jgi:hypothetical protein
MTGYPLVRHENGVVWHSWDGRGWWAGEPDQLTRTLSGCRVGQSRERSFGFEYEYKGKQYASHIVAESREEAEGCAAALIPCPIRWGAAIR